VALEFKDGSVEVEKSYGNSLRFNLHYKSGPHIFFHLDYATARALCETIVCELKKVEIETRLIAAPEAEKEECPF